MTVSYCAGLGEILIDVDNELNNDLHDAGDEKIAMDSRSVTSKAPGNESKNFYVRDNNLTIT